MNAYNLVTAAVVRDERCRQRFTRIGWITSSQQPDILQLQSRLYQQLHGLLRALMLSVVIDSVLFKADDHEMPKKAR